MSSLNQLVSEIAHSIKQADSVPVRRAIKLGIIHSRNELIRKNYENHKYTDQVLKQSFKLSLITVQEADLSTNYEEQLDCIKRTANKVPRPVRITNNLPFHSVRTAGIITAQNIPYVGESVNQFYNNLPGMIKIPRYFYSNNYIYIMNINPEINNIIVESVFEYPHMIPTETKDNGIIDIPVNDDDEFLLPEDMINEVKQLVLKSLNANIQQDTNEVKNTNLVN